MTLDVTEQELVRRAREGEGWAMRALHERYASLVFSVVRRFADDDDTARDWEQEAWIGVFRGLAEYRGDAELASWLHRVAVNAALQGQRRARKHTNGRDHRDAGEVEAVGTNGDTAERILLRLELAEALERMPPRMREILLLHDVEGFRHDEIATLLEITDGASRSQLFKARVKLRALMDGDNDSNGGGPADAS